MARTSFFRSIKYPITSTQNFILNILSLLRILILANKN